MEDLLYRVGLTLIPDVGAVTAKKLIRHCGNPLEVFQSSKRQLMSIPGIGEKTIAKIKNPAVLRKAELELQNMDRAGVEMLFYTDESFPEKLKQYHESPIALYYQGDFDTSQKKVVAIIGTRKPSAQGLAICESLIEGLQTHQIVVLSGMAFGIDVCAHRKALDLNLSTWSVMAHGHQFVYPAAHRSLVQQIVNGGGATISEYPYSRKAEKEFFPMRNRIVAGLCDALIVVETPKRGGSMITAHQANNYNKDVFAVPGRVNDRCAQGCNHLIKTHKAALLESAEDLIYVMGWEDNKSRFGIQKELFVQLSEEEKIIVDLLRQESVLSVDQLNYRISNSANQLSSHLLNLEFQGLIKSLPGNRYTIVK